MWVKGISVLEEENIIFIWSQQVFTVNDLEGKIIFEYKELTEYENFITDVVYNQKFGYFITSTMRGKIFVWKF